ncbi:MAG: NUDIX domain-containing protein [Nitrospirales bacterium]|nr:NUDIX domain-containing protein [Nitrospirales bacterium]
MEEMLDIVDNDGNTIRTAPRSVIHGDPSLLHKVVHVLVFDDQERVLLQKRALTKDVAPGRWDTSVGGHIASGEELALAATREMEEELGVLPEKLTYLYSYIHSNPYESELVYTYMCRHNGPFSFNKEEIDEVRFWDIKEIRDAMTKGILSDNFESEIKKYMEHISCC